MIMSQAGVFKASVCAVAVSVVTTVCAQDAAQPAEAAPAEQPAAAADAAPAAEAQQQQPVNFFPALVRIMNIQGLCEVKNPDVGQYVPAQNNKAYPLGSFFRTGLGGSASLLFSAQESAQLLENSEVVALCAEKNPNARVIRLLAGKIKTNLRDNMPEGSFGVETPNTACKNSVGRAEFSLTSDAALETLQIATITGSSRVEGPQYHIPALRAANTVNIQTAADRSLTRLTSVSGDFAIILEKGAEEPVTFGMTPKAVVKIWRENAPVGGRAIISTLVVAPSGMARHRFAYAVGRDDLTTGELISQMDEKKEEDLPVLLSTEPKKADAPAEKVENKEKEEAQ